MRILFILLAVFSFNALADSSFVSPRYYLKHSNGELVEGFSYFNNITKCVTTAYNRSDGDYLCDHDPVKIKVNNNRVVIKIIPPTTYVDSDKILTVDEIDELKVYVNDREPVSISGDSTSHKVYFESREYYTIRITTLVNGKESSGSILTGKVN